MAINLTYQFYEGNIWRWSNMGVIRSRWECFYTDRDEAQRIHDQYARSAETKDFFQRRAKELRDEMAEAIRQYDEFQTKKVA